MELEELEEAEEEDEEEEEEAEELDLDSPSAAAGSSWRFRFFFFCFLSIVAARIGAARPRRGRVYFESKNLFRLFSGPLLISSLTEVDPGKALLHLDGVRQVLDGVRYGQRGRR